jgi:hypothetical protein
VGKFREWIGGKWRLKVGVKSLQVEETEGLNYLDHLHQEMKGTMGEVSPWKSFQHRVESRRAVRARRQGRALSAGAARIVDEEKKGEPVSNGAHFVG